MKANRKVNLTKTPVYIPNQPFAKGGDKWTYGEDNRGYDKERSKEETIHMKMAKRKGK